MATNDHIRITDPDVLGFLHELERIVLEIAEKRAKSPVQPTQTASKRGIMNGTSVRGGGS